MNKFNIYAFADEASPFLKDQIIAMKRNNLQGIEIRNTEGVNVSDLTVEQAKNIRSELDAAGLVVGSLGSPLGKIDIEKDDFAAHLEKFKRSLEIAHILGTKKIRLFSFYIPEGKNPEDYKGEVIDRLGQFTLAAKGSGIVLCHENEKGIYGDIAPRCLEIFKALPELKCVFDPANFVQSGQETLSAWEMLCPYVHYMHIKDAEPDGNVVPAGKGAGNLEKIISNYVANGGTDFTLEPHLTVFSGLAGLEREGERSNVGNFVYASPDEAFDVACNSLKDILAKL